MIAKEKAKELVEKFKFETKQSEIINDIILGDVSVIFQHHKAKQCALIAVDEILNALDSERIIYGSEYRFEENTYWEEVKQEIEKL